MRQHVPSCRGSVPISPKGGSGCLPEVPDGRQLSGHTPRLTALTTAWSLDTASIDTLKQLEVLCFLLRSTCVTTICRCLTTTRPRLHHHTARPANPRISDRCRMSTHGAALRPGGGCLAFVLSRTPIFRQRGTAPTAHARATGRTGWAAADTWSVCVAVGRTHDDSRCMRHRQEAAPSVCGT